MSEELLCKKCNEDDKENGLKKKGTKFHERQLPEEVYFGFIAHRVSKYIPKPLRCFNCQEFRHVAAACKRNCRCTR